MIINAEDYFEHHGVKGQRWGVVKKDDTGGDSSSKTDTPSIRERIGARNLSINKGRQAMLQARAAKGKIKLSEINTELKALPPGVKTVFKRKTLVDLRNVTAKQVHSDLKKASKPPTSGLTSTQKKLLIGAGVVGVMIGVHELHKYTDVEGIAASIARGESQLKYGDVFRHNNELAGKMNPNQVLDKVVKGINPNYGSSGGHMNCRRCTFAYELRRRGFDVAATTTPTGYGQNESGLVNALIKGDKNLLSRQSMSEFAFLHNPPPEGLRARAARGDLRVHTAFQERVQEVGQLRAALSKHPVGARGEAVFDIGPFAHSLQWENFADGPHLFDSQKASHYPVTSKGLKDLTVKWGNPARMEITRLDNVDLDLSFLSRWAKNVGE